MLGVNVTVEVVFDLLHADVFELLEHQDEAVVGHLARFGGMVFKVVGLQRLRRREVKDGLLLRGLRSGHHLDGADRVLAFIVTVVQIIVDV